MLEQEGSSVWLQDNDLGWIGGTVLAVGKSNSNMNGGGASQLKILDERGRVCSKLFGVGGSVWADGIW